MAGPELWLEVCAFGSAVEKEGVFCSEATFLMRLTLTTVFSNKTCPSSPQCSQFLNVNCFFLQTYLLLIYFIISLFCLLSVYFFFTFLAHGSNILEFKGILYFACPACSHSFFSYVIIFLSLRSLPHLVWNLGTVSVLSVVTLKITCIMHLRSVILGSLYYLYLSQCKDLRKLELYSFLI